MTQKLIYNEFKKYFAALPITATICSSLGTTFSASSNLFIGSEPENIGSCLTLIPYGGGPPSPEGDKREAAIQIRLKSKSLEYGLKTQSAIIDALHNNTNICASTHGRISAIQSEPIPIGWQEGKEYVVIVSNYIVKHTKLN